MKSTINLPAPSKQCSMTLAEAIASRKSCRKLSTEPVSMQELSDLLWAAFGFRGPERRTAPSSHNRQETSLYVCLESGAYLYDAQANTLVPVVVDGKDVGDIRVLTGLQEFAATAPVNIVYVADKSLITGKDERGVVETIYVDTGFIAENVYLWSSAAGFANVVRAMVDKPALARALGLADNQEITLVHTVGRFAPRE